MAWQPISPWKLKAPHVVTYTGTAGQSTAMGSQTRALLLTATSNCHIAIDDPSFLAAATTSSTYLPANVPIVVGCSPGNEVSVIQDSASGSLYITELDH